MPIALTVLYQEKLELEKSYNRAASMMSEINIANLVYVRSVFEALNGYKDSAAKAATCDKYIDSLCEKKYQEAIPIPQITLWK